MKFHGIAKDLRGFGVSPDPADLKGFVSGNEIHFVKQYPSFHYAEPNIVVDRSKKGGKIYYEGIFDTEGNHVKGTWRMPARRSWFRQVAIATSGT